MDVSEVVRNVANGVELNKPEEKNKAYWASKISSASMEEESWRIQSRAYRNLYLQRLNRITDQNKIVPEALMNDGHDTRKNIFYANTELLAAALLPVLPSPAITRRYGKENAVDEQELQFYGIAADVVQRTIMQFVEQDDTIDNFTGFKYDYLITGRGVLWVVYTDQKISLKHVRITDFRMSGGRSWEEVTWIARRMVMTRREVAAEWRDEVAAVIEPTFPTPEDKQEKVSSQNELPPAIEIWEIWDKDTKKVYWFCPGADELLEVQDDPYNLDDFFPIAEPLRSIKDYYSMIPVPELNLYLREAADLSLVCKRIAILISGIRGRTFYPQRYGDLVSTLQTAPDNAYIALGTTGEVNDAGGLEQVFLFEPMQERVNVCEKLKEQKQDLETDIYDITGISDIIRGVETQEGVDPETASASILKGRFGSLRLQARQQAFNHYLKETYGIMAQLICNFFTPDTLVEISAMNLPTAEEKQQFQQQQQELQQQQEQMQQLPQKQQEQMQQQMPPEPTPEEEAYANKPTMEEVAQYLKDHKLRSYLLNVETTLNVWDKGLKEQSARTKIMQTIGEQLQTIMPMLQENLTLAKVYFKMIMFTLGAYEMPQTQRLELEDSFAAVVTEIRMKQEEEAKNPPQPSPEEMTAQAEMMKGEAEQGKVENEKENNKLKAQIEQMKAENERERIENEKMEVQYKAQMEQMGLEIREKESQIDVLRIQTEAETKQLELQVMQQMKMQEIQSKHELGQQKNAIGQEKNAIGQQKAALDAQIKKADTMRKSIADDNKARAEQSYTELEGYKAEVEQDKIDQSPKEEKP